MGRTSNFVTSRPNWPATLTQSSQSSEINRGVTCHRLDTTIVFVVDGQKHHQTNVIGPLNDVRSHGLSVFQGLDVVWSYELNIR